MLRVTNIIWDIDDEDNNLYTVEEIHSSLPTELIVEDAEITEDDVAGFLSDEFGWCVKSFSIDNNGYSYKLTKTGLDKVNAFIRECEAKRKEILDAGKDTADETTIPSVDDIISDITYGEGVDEDGDYYNLWGVTDNYNSDYPCALTKGVDFVRVD